MGALVRDPEIGPDFGCQREHSMARSVTSRYRRRRSAEALPAGRSRFRLVVVDNAGNESEPSTIEIVVRDDARPIAVLDIVDASEARVAPAVGAGKSFILSGARSSDLAPGKIIEYRFTLLPAV